VVLSTEEESMTRRKRRTFSKEQKAEAVRLIKESGDSITVIAHDLDIHENTLRKWYKQAELDAGRGRESSDALTTSEKAEIRRLKRENRKLRMERDFLKKATAFFAKESSDDTK